jgi:hypothetical protein
LRCEYSIDQVVYGTLLEAVIESGPYATNAILLIATTVLKFMPSLKCRVPKFPEIGEKETVAKFVTVYMRTLFCLRCCTNRDAIWANTQV